MTSETPLTFTGERLVPGQVEPDLYAEHITRYQFASSFANGKRVLDAGCGTGYGARLLASVAAEVVGFDRSIEAIRYAIKHFNSPNLSYLVGDCESIPCPDASFDIIVTFEVIEHLPDPARYVQELARVLAPAGLLVLSTPNKRQYSDALPGYKNPYHTHEFYFAEWDQLLTQTFPIVQHFAQEYTHALAFREFRASYDNAFVDRVHEDGPEGNRLTRDRFFQDTQFFVALCAHDQAALSAPRPNLFLLSQSNLLAEKDRWIAALRRQVDEAREEVEHANRVIAELQQQLAEQTAWAQRAVSDVQQRDKIIQELQQQLAEQTRLSTAGRQQRARS